MNSKLSLAALVAAASLAAGVANATTISISTFSTAAFDAEAAGVTEDFEALGASMGVGSVGPSLVTGTVGNFESLGGGPGSGGTCGISGTPAPCTEIALAKDNVFSQGNLVPADGEWSLNSNDTGGIGWDAFLDSGGTFNRIVFAMKDAADRPGVSVKVSADGVSETITKELDGNEKLVVIDFSSRVSMARVDILNIFSATRVINDSFSIDGASVGVVPVPAAGLLLLGGLGAFAAVRRRKTA